MPCHRHDVAAWEEGQGHGLFCLGVASVYCALLLLLIDCFCLESLCLIFYEIDELETEAVFCGRCRFIFEFGDDKIPFVALKRVLIESQCGF